MYRIILRTPYPNELYHHGIKGQHWGVRNGPPYPLDAKTSARIRRGDNEKVRFSSKEYRDMRSGKSKYKVRRAGTSHYAGFGERLMGDTDTSYRKRDENGNIITVPVVEGSQAGFILKNDPDAYRTQRKGITSSDLMACNGNNYYTDSATERFSTLEDGRQNNCVKCTNTLEMRKRGYDVVAGRTSEGMLSSATQYYWDGALPYKERSVENVEKRLSAFGHNGSGEISITYKGGSGHSMYFMNERDPETKEWKSVVMDGQTGERYGSVSDMVDYFKGTIDIDEGFRITRLDTATPNFGHMGEDSVFVGRNSEGMATSTPYDRRHDKILSDTSWKEAYETTADRYIEDNYDKIAGYMDRIKELYG